MSQKSRGLCALGKFKIETRCYSTFANSSLPTPQMGQTQSSGKSSKAVPGAIPLSGSPTAGS